MVFQPPQASHLPDHFACVAPQDWQTKLGEDLAIRPPHPRLRNELRRLALSPLGGEGKREQLSMPAKVGVRGKLLVAMILV